MKKRVLLTGAAGGIGSAFFRAEMQNYTFRLADINTLPLADVSSEHEVMALDIADLHTCQQACRDIDTVLHLAATPNPEADFYQDLLSKNIQGVYNIFRAAKDQGCQRVIFASSVQVLAGYPTDVQPHLEAPLRPINMYGVSKCFGEAVASYFAHAEGLSSIAVRIGAYDLRGDPTNPLRRHPGMQGLGAYVSERDLNQLLMRCIEEPGIQFAIVHGISNNRFKRIDLEATRETVHYAPQDDSFEVFGDSLQDWLRT